MNRIWILIVLLLIDWHHSEAQWQKIPNVYGGEPVDAVMGERGSAYSLMVSGNIYKLSVNDSRWRFVDEFPYLGAESAVLSVSETGRIYCKNSQGIYSYLPDKSSWKIITSFFGDSPSIQSYTAFGDSGVALATYGHLFETRNVGASWNQQLNYKALPADCRASLLNHFGEGLTFVTSDSVYYTNNLDGPWAAAVNNINLGMMRSHVLIRTMYAMNNGDICKQTDDGVAIYCQDQRRWKNVYKFNEIGTFPTVHAQGENVFFSLRKRYGRYIFYSKNGGDTWDSTKIESMPLGIVEMFFSDGKSVYIDNTYNWICGVDFESGSVSNAMTGIEECVTNRIAVADGTIHSRYYNAEYHCNKYDNGCETYYTQPFSERQLYLFKDEVPIRTMDQLVEWSTNAGRSWDSSYAISNNDAALYRKTGDIYFSTMYGLLKFNLDRSYFEYIDTCSSQKVDIDSESGRVAVAGIELYREYSNDTLVYETALPTGNAKIYDMVLSRNGQLVISTDLSVYRLTPEDRLWTSLPTVNGGIVKMVPCLDSIIVGLTVDSRLVYSRDFASSWTSLETGDVSARIMDMAEYRDTLYVCTSGAGLYYYPLAELLLSEIEPASGKPFGSSNIRVG